MKNDEQPSNGSVDVSLKNAKRGDTVEITVRPEAGYVVETISVVDENGRELALTDKGDGLYTFTMPAGEVEVKVSFMGDNAVLNFFYDVPNAAYFYDAVKWAVENGSTAGVNEGFLHPISLAPVPRLSRSCGVRRVALSCRAWRFCSVRSVSRPMARLRSAMFLRIAIMPRRSHGLWKMA